MTTDLDKTKSALSVDQQQVCSAVFTHRIPANDGGLPFDFIDRRNDDYDCACVYRGDHDLGTGSKLLEAWDNYLYSISPGEAPVDDGVLAAMWAAYDEWVDLPNVKTVATCATGDTNEAKDS